MKKIINLIPLNLYAQQGTIKNADLIYCFDKGRIVESGTHFDLMNLKGRYYSLVITKEQESEKNNDIELPTVESYIFSSFIFLS